MKIYWLLIFWLCFCLSSETLKAASESQGFKVLDKICVLVEGEEPILLSEINKRVKVRGETFLDAELALTRERLLWVYAKKQLKYDVANIFRAADDHIEKVRKDNKLTAKKFEEVLMRLPYETTLRKFRIDTATDYLKNLVMQDIRSKIAISEEQLKEEATKKFEVAFITISSKKTAQKSQRTPIGGLSPEFRKANAIRSQIHLTTTVNDIKTLYGRDQDVSLVGPIAYEKDVLKKAYDERLTSDPSSLVIGPFYDDGSVTMIWKIKKTMKNLDETALEKLRKESYHSAVAEKFNSLTDALIKDSTVTVRGCGNP